MKPERVAARAAEEKELVHFRNGAVFGLAGGVVGLVLPLSVSFLGVFSLVGQPALGATLASFASIFVLVGAILLEISLIFYQWAFRTLRQFDQRFLAAVVLCLVGTVGFLLIITSMVVPLATTPSLVQCIETSPSQALACLSTAPPLTGYSVIVGFWLAWCGGLGIIVGLAICGERYREIRLISAGALYTLLLLVLITPFVGIIFPSGGWQYPLLTIPALAVIAPALVLGSSYVRKSVAPKVRRTPSLPPSAPRFPSQPSGSPPVALHRRLASAVKRRTRPTPSTSKSP